MRLTVWSGGGGQLTTQVALAGEPDRAVLLALSDCECLVLSAERGGQVVSLDPSPPPPPPPLPLSGTPTAFSHTPGLLSRCLSSIIRLRLDVALIACSPNLVVIAAASNEVFSSGLPGSPVDCLVPHMLPQASKTRKIAVGHNHAMIILGQQQLWGLGRSVNSESSGSWALQPVRIELPTSAEIVDVACGFDFTVVATTQHTYTFGVDCYHRLGLGSDGVAGGGGQCRPGYVGAPALVEGLEGAGTVALLAASTFHSVAVMAGTDEVFGWGWGKWGQLGAGPGGDREQIIATPQRIEGLEDAPVRGVSCGSRHTALVYDDGRVLVMGTVGPEVEGGGGGGGGGGGNGRAMVVVAKDGLAAASYHWGLAVLS